MLLKVFKLEKTQRKLPVPEFLYFCQVCFANNLLSVIYTISDSQMVIF